jgi:hypothetical protein
VIAKHDGSTPMKVRMSEFLADCAERIIVLGIIHRRVINRFKKFLVYLGLPSHSIKETKPNIILKTISEFALEYRTTRERVKEQLEKKANHRERNKTRGKMITEVILIILTLKMIQSFVKNGQNIKQFCLFYRWISSKPKNNRQTMN